MRLRSTSDALHRVVATHPVEGAWRCVRVAAGDPDRRPLDREPVLEPPARQVVTTTVEQLDRTPGVGPRTEQTAPDQGGQGSRGAGRRTSAGTVRQRARGSSAAGSVVLLDAHPGQRQLGLAHGRAALRRHRRSGSASDRLGGQVHLPAAALRGAPR